MPRTKSQLSGVPGDLSLKLAQAWVYPKVSENRFKHIEGVVKVARLLAEECGEDVFAAELAAWLHDACKELKDKELLARARARGIKLDPIEAQNGHLLHGPVAAFAAESELSLTNRTILDAISQHTLGSPNMAPLAKIIFLADCLEESRPPSYTDPIWNALKRNETNILNEAAQSKATDYNESASGIPTEYLNRTQVSSVETKMDEATGKELKRWQSMAKIRTKTTRLDVDAAVLVACDLNLKHLIDGHKVIHPRTVEARNYYLEAVKARTN